MGDRDGLGISCRSRCELVERDVVLAGRLLGGRKFGPALTYLDDAVSRRTQGLGRSKERLPDDHPAGVQQRQRAQRTGVPPGQIGLRGRLLQHRHRRAQPPDALYDGSDILGPGGQHGHPAAAGDSLRRQPARNPHRRLMNVAPAGKPQSTRGAEVQTPRGIASGRCDGVGKPTHIPAASHLDGLAPERLSRFPKIARERALSIEFLDTKLLTSASNLTLSDHLSRAPSTAAAMTSTARSIWAVE